MTPPAKQPLPLATLFPLRALVITLQFTESAHPRFFHQAALTAFLRLSPLMANLILDDLDRDMQRQGFRLIRFADDFVVLCKDPETAKQAQQAAQQSLREHGLDIHPDKERLSDMDRGFRYLGYLFIKDMALDISTIRQCHALLMQMTPLIHPIHGWLHWGSVKQCMHKVPSAWLILLRKFVTNKPSSVANGKIAAHF